MPDYLLRADQCPAPMAPSGLIVPADQVPIGFEGVQPGTNPWTPYLLRDASRMQAVARYGGGAYGVVYGLDLGEPTGLTVPVSAGQAMIDHPATLASDSSIVAVEGRNWVWLSRSGVVEALTSTAQPDTPAALLGSILVSGGTVVSRDYSGRVELRHGGAWRRTADVAQPGDAPPANWRGITRTQGGLYLWDEDTYWLLSQPPVVSLRPWYFVVPAYETTYRVEATLPAGFADESAFRVVAIADGAGVIIYEDMGNRAANRFALLIYVRSDAPSGYYPGALNVRLSVRLQGHGWTGSSLTDVVATWSGPTEVL